MNKTIRSKPLNKNRLTKNGSPKYLPMRTSLPKPSQSNDDRPVRIVDLFCGCGGLSLGALAGLSRHHKKAEIALAIDTSRAALDVYQSNIDCKPGVVRHIDVRKVFPGNLGAGSTTVERAVKKQVGRVDLLIAGPPCQGHSDLNNSSRRNDPRNSLYNRVIRAAEIIKPTAILIENVATVVHDKNGIVNSSIAHLRSLNYHVSTQILELADFGIPQLRRRHILLATRKESSLDGITNSVNSRKYNVRDCIGDIAQEFLTRSEIFFTPSTMSAANQKRAQYLYKNNAYELPDRLRPPCHKNKVHSYKSVYGRLRWGSLAGTITSGFGSMGQGRFLHPSHPRVITPHEAARLQGFPDSFSFASVTQRGALQEMIGNAVPPNLSAALVSHLIQQQLL